MLAVLEIYLFWRALAQLFERRDRPNSKSLTLQQFFALFNKLTIGKVAFYALRALVFAIVGCCLGALF